MTGGSRTRPLAPSRDRPAWTPTLPSLRCRSDRTRRRLTDFQKRSLSFFLRPTRTGGTSAGAIGSTLAQAFLVSRSLWFSKTCSRALPYGASALRQSTFVPKAGLEPAQGSIAFSRSPNRTVTAPPLGRALYQLSYFGMLPVYSGPSAMPYSITVTFSMSLSCSCSHAFAVFLAVSFHIPPSASRKVMPRSLIRMRKIPSGCSISWKVR